MMSTFLASFTNDRDCVFSRIYNAETLLGDICSLSDGFLHFLGTADFPERVPEGEADSGGLVPFGVLDSALSHCGLDEHQDRF